MRRAVCMVGAAIVLLLWQSGISLRASAEVERRHVADFHTRSLLDGEVVPGEAYAVPLSQEAVEAARKGREVRLFDSAGREIPSLLHTAVRHAEIVRRPTRVFNRTWQEDGTQTLSVEQSDRRPEAVNEFEFEIDDAEYNARVRIEGSEDGVDWRILADGLHLIRHSVESEKVRYVHNVLRIPAARFRFYRFTLRSQLAQGEDDFEPLAIVGIDVREVVWRGSQLSIPVALERYADDRDPDTRHHYWKLDLGRESLGVDSLELRTPAAGFARAASLWEWSVERGRRTRLLASTVLFRYGDDDQLGLSGFTTDARMLALMVDQGDDDPVDLGSARASRPRQQLRFLATSDLQAPLALYFEPDEARPPDYDLVRRLREDEIRSFAELALGPLGPNPGFALAPQPASERVPFLLYALVIPLVVGLGWYVVRTIRAGIPPEAS